MREIRQVCARRACRSSPQSPAEAVDMSFAVQGRPRRAWRNRVRQRRLRWLLRCDGDDDAAGPRLRPRRSTQLHTGCRDQRRLVATVFQDRESDRPACDGRQSRRARDRRCGRQCQVPLPQRRGPSDYLRPRASETRRTMGSHTRRQDVRRSGVACAQRSAATCRQLLARFRSRSPRLYPRRSIVHSSRNGS